MPSPCPTLRKICPASLAAASSRLSTAPEPSMLSQSDQLIGKRLPSLPLSVSTYLSRCRLGWPTHLLLIPGSLQKPFVTSPPRKSCVIWMTPLYTSRTPGAICGSPERSWPPFVQLGFKSPQKRHSYSRTTSSTWNMRSVHRGSASPRNTPRPSRIGPFLTPSRLYERSWGSVGTIGGSSWITPPSLPRWSNTPGRINMRGRFLTSTRTRRQSRPSGS